MEYWDSHVLFYDFGNAQVFQVLLLGKKIRGKGLRRLRKKERRKFRKRKLERKL